MLWAKCCCNRFTFVEMIYGKLELTLSAVSAVKLNWSQSKHATFTVSTVSFIRVISAVIVTITDVTFWDTQSTGRTLELIWAAMYFTNTYDINLTDYTTRNYWKKQIITNPHWLLSNVFNVRWSLNYDYVSSLLHWLSQPNTISIFIFSPLPQLFSVTRPIFLQAVKDEDTLFRFRHIGNCLLC